MPRGRPRAFDRDAALETAMTVFWRHGYDETSISALTEAMGIASPSLYAAFGSKAALFCEAADLYQRLDGAEPERRMRRRANGRDAIEALLLANVELFTQRERPHGCLLTLAAASYSAADAEVGAYLARTKRERIALIEARLFEAERAGERLPPGDPALLADYYDTVVQGLAVRAREGASRRRLREVVALAMASWSRGEAPAGAAPAYGQRSA